MHQSPEIEDSTESKDDPITPRYAMSGFHIEKGGFQYAAATDARHRWHDMAAGVTLKKSLTEPIRRIRKVWVKFGSFRLETEKTKGMIRLLESGKKRKSSHPLRVCGKVVILQCRWPVNRAGRKIDPTSNLAEIATKNKSSYLLGAFFISFALCGFFLDMGRRSNAVSSSCFDFPYHSVVTISLNSLPSR